MTTLEEIAALSKVSRSTVSRVINDDPHVSAQTRKRVLEVVRRLNYRPHAAARSLAAGHSQIIGLIIPAGVSTTFGDPYFSILIEGIASACSARDYSVMLWLAEAEYERRMIKQVLRNGLLDGIVCSSMYIADEIVEALIAAELPFVLIGKHPERDDLNYVDVANRQGAREGVGHLLRLGHRDVATITGPLNAIAGIDRREGYLDALRARGLAAAPRLMVEGDFTEEGGYYAMKQLFAQQPDAVFVASDTMAVGALRALREAGVRVPQDMALVSFDDAPLASRTMPPLTTVRQPIKRSGAVAVESLIDLIEFPDTSQHRVILPTELVIRQSCGASG